MLVVDDEADNRAMMIRALRSDFDVLTASNGQEALGVLAKTEVSVILTDNRMPGMSGIELLRHAAQCRPDAKRLLLTAYADVDGLIQAINEAGVHYLVLKPWHPHQLRSTLRDLVRVRRMEGENRSLLEELELRNRELAERGRLLSRDLDERGKELLELNARLLASNEELSRLAVRDGLTGLYNHRVFQERLREEVSRALRYGHPCSLVLVDLDHFKRFNDRHGHPAGTRC